MRRITYNISQTPVINWKKTLGRILGIFFLSCFLIIAGIVMISNNRKELKENLTTLNKTEQDLESLEKEGKKWKEEILARKNQWKKEIGFINELIQESTKPIVAQMSLLEEILPDGVFIKEFSLNEVNKRFGILIQVSAGEFSDLLKFYDKLKSLKNHLVYSTSRETFSDIESVSTIKITFRDNEIKFD